MSPKSPRSVLVGLREQCRDRAGGVCEWPGCRSRGEEMAHLEHRGMGGRVSVDRFDNVVWLCRFHHLMLDGEVLMRKSDRAGLLRAAVGRGVSW